MAAKKAQERSDRVFLSLFLRDNPLEEVLGIVVGVGEKTCNVFVPSIGISREAFFEESPDLVATVFVPKEHIVLRPKEVCDWPHIDIKVLQKIVISCFSKPRPPVDVLIKILRPYAD